MADAALAEVLEIARVLVDAAPESATFTEARERLKALSRGVSAGATMPAVGGARMKAHRLLLACTELVVTRSDAARQSLREEIAAQTE